MKNVDSMSTYCEARNENYILALTSDEFYLIKSALDNYADTLKDEIETYDWLDTPQEHERLRRIDNLVDELYKLPF